MGWRDDEARFVKMVREQRGHVGFAQAHDIGQESAPIFVEYLARIQHRLFLILQFFEASRQKDVLNLGRQIKLVSKIFVQKFEVKLVRREMRKWRAIEDRVFVRFPKIDSEFPQFVKLSESEFVVSARLEFNVKLEIIEKAGLRKVT